jgi:SAM-dependent methyltransferase
VTTRDRAASRLTRLLSFLAFVFASGLLAAPVARAADHHQHSFSGAEKWAKIFDDPERDAWQKPDEVIRALKLGQDALIADVGAGTGYFAVRLARAAPKGRVYAVDVEPDMVRYLGERARREKVDNLVPVTAGSNDPRIPSPVDLVILVDTYHHVLNRERYFRALQKSIKPGGRLAIVDFKLDSPVGPPKRARIAPEKVKKELAGAGYKLVREHAFLPHQYFLEFAPN